jgi:putative ABC transport system permease protein
LEVGDNFLTTMGIDVIEGRNFHEGEKNVVIFNEAARKQLDLKLNDRIMFSGGVVGFVEDFHYKSFREKITPMAFGVTENVGNKLVVRLNAPERVDEVICFVNEQNQRISGGRCELTFYTPDRMFGSTYANEMKQLKLLLVGAIVSLLIPLIGVFGLVLFETRAKRKEIGIRKVFGATTRGILVMFNMQYLRTLAMCFILAAPVAHALYNRWIESFAYRTPMHWWLFAVAFLIVSLVVCLTVTIQSWRAAKERPVETIMK